MPNKIQGNIRKTFAYILTNRRHYIVLVSIYFLMQPDATQQMLGYSMSLGMLVGFLLEIPSGYIADRIGHRKTLIIAKWLMLITTCIYIATDFVPHVAWFFAGSAFFSMSIAFTSGTISAFLHETLTVIGKDSKFSEIFGKIKGNVSIIQAISFLTLPMIAQYNFMIPFYIGLVLDIFGLYIAYSYIQPQIHLDVKEHKSIFQIIKSLSGTGFYPLAIFFSLIGSFFIGFVTFREPYLLSIGLSLFFVGAVSAGSRLTRFLLSKFTGWIHQTFTLKQLMTIETLFFSFYFIGAALSQDIYIVGSLLAIGLGYRYARGPIITQYLIEALPDKRYKATMLSLKAQLGGIFGIFTPIAMGYLLTLDIQFGEYRDGLIIRGIILFILLGSTLLYAITHDTFPKKQKI